MLAGFVPPTPADILLDGASVVAAARAPARYRRGVPDLRAVSAHERRPATSPSPWRKRACRGASAPPACRRGAAAGAAGRLGDRRPSEARAASSSAWRWPARWCSSPTVLLLDEPLARSTPSCGEMQPRSAAARRLGSPCYVTHDQSEALRCPTGSLIRARPDRAVRARRRTFSMETADGPASSQPSSARQTASPGTVVAGGPGEIVVEAAGGMRLFIRFAPSGVPERQPRRHLRAARGHRHRRTARRPGERAACRGQSRATRVATRT